jgi:N-ethylmaleimide reductase
MFETTLSKEIDMALDTLFSEYTLGEIHLKNRVVMAPMTRSRCDGNIPGPLVATYYGQRADAGLIITEGASPSPNGVGYPRIPGIYADAQVDGWRAVTEAVHRKGGRIFLQLMHTGRIGHPLNLPKGARVLAPSAVAAPDTMYTDSQGMQPFPVPETMTESDISNAVAEYAAASKNALRAGFDGVELHGANGYLIDQFLNTASNKRSDAFGKTPEGRSRFALRVATAVIDAIGPSRVGIRLSPAGGFNGMNTDADAFEVYSYLVRELNGLGLVYVHLVDHSSLGTPAPTPELVAEIRRVFTGTLILSGGYDGARAERMLSERACDLVAFGRPFIANPSFPSKLKNNQTLLTPDFETFYTPGEKSCTDYPV